MGRLTDRMQTSVNNSSPSYGGRLTPDSVSAIYKNYNERNIVEKSKTVDTLPTQEQYKFYNEAKKAGLITTAQQQDAIKFIANNEQVKIQQTDNRGTLTKIGDAITDFTTRPIIETSKTIGTGIAAEGNYLIKELSGANKKLRQDIADSIAKENQIRLAFNKQHPMSSLAAEQQAVQPQKNLTQNLQSTLNGLNRDVRENADPLKMLGAAGVIGTTVGALGLGGAAGAIGRLGTTPTLVAAGKIAGTTLGGMALGSAGGASYQLSQTGLQTTPEQYNKAAIAGTAVGGALSLAIGSIGQVFEAKAAQRLAAIKQAESTRNVLPDLTDAQVSKFGPQKINVSADSVPTKVNVKVASKMTDEVYGKKFNVLSKSYDKEIKALESMPLVKQKIMSDAIESRYQKLLLELDNEYQNPQFKTAGKTPVTTTKTTGTTLQVSKTPIAEPVTGTPKISGSAIRTQALAVEAGMKENFSEMAGYSSGSSKVASARAVDIVNDNIDNAWDIVNGKVPTDNLQKGATFTAMENKFTKEANIEGLRRLAKSQVNTEFSSAGQLLGAKGLDSSPYSAVSAMDDLSKTKILGAEKRTGIKVSQAKLEAQSVVRQATKLPNRDSWVKFVESIKC